MLREESEEVIVRSISETTALAGREGPLLQPRSARGSVTRHTRKGQPHPFEPSRPLQRKLYQAAKRSRNRRFHALYDRMFRPDMLWRAWREVRANGGSAGIDEVQRDDVERPGVTTFLQALAQDLRAGSDRPQPVRRVYSPKPDGRQRPLGMPTVRDRVVQQACKIVIEPLVEANV
jgi:RNA-directed DNA polymerase